MALTRAAVTLAAVSRTGGHKLALCSGCSPAETSHEQRTIGLTNRFLYASGCPSVKATTVEFLACHSSTTARGGYLQSMAPDDPSMKGFHFFRGELKQYFVNASTPNTAVADPLDKFLVPAVEKRDAQAAKLEPQRMIWCHISVKRMPRFL
ncbi:hypothetical protein QBC40DRAFT_264145 [Triangularia verruculosa]|uniref:Uncharacterized protein n=1 Tax=Triangularia verruculosa TaxID=2587418 RepID=A0AAN6XPM5_9PEZI|nr:hypothetical protein QBC40DRAFT_264145 [Triangularia verruculosa]